MNVFFTVDVEVWCDGWSDLDARFADAFRRYVYGPTGQGEAGLRYQARVLNDFGLRGVFFVEPLFATRFGLEPLREIVELIDDAQHEIQLHLHPEWADEARTPLVPTQAGKRPLMRQYDRADQITLVREGQRLLAQCGVTSVDCFRAGSFGFDTNTLAALGHCGIANDSSYNATMYGLDSGLAPGIALGDVHVEGSLAEYPLTVFDDGFGRLRHAQLGSCSWSELEAMLWQAAQQQRRSFVILSHNFELLSPSKQGLDSIVHRRFRSLCQFLDRHRDTFTTTGFSGLSRPAAAAQPPPLRSTRARTAWRTVEQAWRRSYR